jgi:membrane-bound lytic murein transglycosylase
MKGCWAKYLMTGAMVAILAACSSKPTDRGQQYKDGKLSQPFSLVNQPDAVGAPINAGDFSEQVYQIRNASPRLYGSQNNVYSAVQEWLRAGAIRVICASLVLMPGRWKGLITMATSSLPAITPRDSGTTLPSG